MAMQGPNPPRRFEVDDLTLDTGQCRVLRNGRPLPLSKLTFRLLRLLVERAPNLVGHDECIRYAWGPRRIITPENLAQRIMLLRQALGDSATKPRYIEGVRGEGYRLVPAVREIPEVALQRAAAPVPTEPAIGVDRSRWRFIPGIGALLVAALLVGIVMLPRTSGPPTFTPLTFDGGQKSDPQLSPNGQMLAYSWGGSDFGDRDIWVKQIGRDTAAIRITDDAAHDVEPVWSPDGAQLAFMRYAEDRASIFVVASLGGQARKLIDIEGVVYHLNHRVPTLSWSADGRFLVYAEKPSATQPASLIRLDIESLHKKALTFPNLGRNALGDFQPSISPDGSRVAFVRGGSHEANMDVWIVSSEGGHASRVTTQQWAFCERLFWLESGRELMLTAGSLFEQRVFGLRLSDGRLRAIPGLGENDRWAVARGSRLAFAKFATTGLRIWRVPAQASGDSAAAATDTGLVGSKLMFSPDGKQITWQSRLTGGPQIWVAQATGASPRPITRQKTPAYDPYWSADGENIVFESHDAGNSDVYVVNVTTGRVRNVTSDLAEDRWPTYSRDGRFIYFTSHRDGSPRIYKMPVDGSEAVAITRNTGFHAIESADGQYLYFARQEDSSLWRRHLASGTETRLFELPDWNRGWSLAAQSVFYLRPNGGGFSIRNRNLSTGADEELYSDWGRAFYLTLTPDEQHVLFSREDRLKSELFVADGLSFR